jgi:predicted ATP-dependent Lon-type protease
MHDGQVAGSPLASITENKRDFADLPADIIDKLQIVFYSDPTNVAFRAMGLG